MAGKFPPADAIERIKMMRPFAPENLVEGLGRRAREEINRQADEAALMALAWDSVPQDLIEFGRRHDIEAFARLAWANAYAAGWRAREAEYRRQKDREAEEEER